MRSYSEPPECSVARPSPKSFTNQKSKIPLEESTVDHLRQAIRAQAEGIAHPFKISGPKTFWFRKRITTPALKRATALIIIHLNEVLDLELREESTYHRETGGNPHYQKSDWQYAPLSDDENNARNDVQHINEDIPEGTSGTREPEDNEIGNINNNRLFDNDHHGENELASNVEDYATSQAPNNGGQESQTDLDEVADASSGQTPLASPPPSQETPKTPPRKAGLFSKLVPSRLSNLFMPTPPPSSPVKPPQPATPSIPPSAVQPINFYNRRSSQTPEVSPSLVPASAVPSVVSYSRRSGKTPQLSPPPPSPPAVQPANVYNRRKTPELSPFTAPALAVQPPNTRSRRSTKTPERSPPPIVTPAIEAADVYTGHSTKTPELPPTPRPAPAIRAANVQDRRSSKTLELSPAPTPTPAPAIHLPS
ncbi:MAG: hypothetical protein Q9188_006714, partial [Gyalolechia gomerana]